MFLFIFKVNENGVLSFRVPFTDSSVENFDNSIPLIVPYLEDVDTTRSGSIYYRESSDPLLLQRAQGHIQAVFPLAIKFYPKHLFIATWYRVAPADGGPEV